MKSFENRNFLALAGPEGADVGCACALGADPKRVVLVDKNKKSADHSQWRYPDAHVFHGHLEDILEHRQFGFAFLDFCSQMTDNTLTLAALTVTECLMEQDGFLAITFQCGREQPDDPVYQRVLQEARGLPEENKAQLSRAIVMRSELQRRVRRSYCTTVPIGFWFYQSYVGKGMLPMGVYLCQTHKSSRINWDRANDKANKARPTYEFISDMPAGELVDEIYRLEDQGIDPTLMLNISKGSVAAYKANVTRGSYK